MKLQEKFDKILNRFERENPDARTELVYTSPYELLVAVILSAQCTDKRVNSITPEFFRAFPTPEKLAEADEVEIFGHIRSVSYPNNKTKSLKGMAVRLVNDFNSEVPSDMDSLLSLPGVGRKTANVILSVIFGEAAMAVDTHVFRVSERLGLTTNSRNPLQTEKRLTKYIPEDKIAKAHHWLILHGRYICQARKPRCNECFLTDLCRHHHKSE